VQSDSSRTWILTGSPENYAATSEHGFGVIGIKERNRARALQIARGDQIVLYLTRVMAFAARIRVTGDMYEDRTKIWPGKPGNPDAYPWRFATEPQLVLAEDHWLSAETLVDELEHIGKWPRAHWKLAFQGQLRQVSEADGELLADRMTAAASAHV
jgi:EVE domain